MDKTIEHRLAWLAGIIDGEGWIGFGVRNHSVVSRKGQRWRGKVARFFVDISNTNEAMIVEILAISDILGVKPLPPTLRFKGSTVRQPLWHLVFRDKKSVTPLLTALLPFFIAKRSIAELTLRAMAHRVTHRRGQPGYIQVGSDPVFFSMSEEAHRLNRRGARPQED